MGTVKIVWILPPRGTTWHAVFDGKPKRALCGRTISRILQIGVPRFPLDRCAKCMRIKGPENGTA